MVCGIGTVYSVLKDQLSADDVRMVLHWLDRFGRYPIGMGECPV